MPASKLSSHSHGLASGARSSPDPQAMPSGATRLPCRRILAAAPCLPTLAFKRPQFAGFFAPAVNKKEKRRQPDEQGGPSEHPDFVGQDRFNLLRWEEGDGHCDRRRYHPAKPGKHQGKPRILLFFKALVDRDLQDRAKNV